MATSTNTEKQCRCVLLLTKAGGEMLRGLVMDSVRASGLSLDDFLKTHHYTITHLPCGRKRNIHWAEDVLFPPDGSRTDINKWELNVLCFIVIDICTLVGSLHPTIIDNVEDLKSMRNKLYHAADMTDDEYETCAMQIENIVITSCKYLSNAALLTRVEGIVERIKHDPLSLGEISKILGAWKTMDMRVLAGMNGLHEDHKEIIAYQKENLAESKKLNADQKENLAETKKLIADHEEVKQQLAFLVKQMGSNPKPPVVHAKIQFTNSKRKREVNDSVVIKINAYIEQQKKSKHSEISAHVNESSLKSTEATSVDTSKAGKTQRTDEDSEMISNEAQVYVHLSNTTETKEAIMACIDQQLELVLNEMCNDGTTIKSCYTGSVHLILQCSSVTNLMNKITECLEGKTTKLFIPVQTALRQLEGCEHICLDVILLETWYWECITQIVECLEENLNEELHKVDNVDTMSPEHEDTSNLENIYISVKSAAPFNVMEDMRKRCFSVEMMQKITGLTEAMKNHFETKTFALEINVHKLSLLDSDDAFAGSTSPSSTTDTVSNIEQSPLVYTSTTATSLPVVTTASTQSHPTRLASDSYLELSIVKDPKLVVALDIGTTYSGYAWQWRKDFLNNRSNVEFNTNWGVGALQLHKTKTCILLESLDKENKTFRLDSFGHVAETRYCNYCDEEDDVRKKWFFFARFKTQLYGDRFNEDISVEDYQGQLLPIMFVMSKLIEAMKDHFVKYLKDKGQTVNLDETLWVITVPAIWSIKAKKFMRDAAEKSGIHRKHLLLAHEPESAALYCMHLPAEQKMEMNNFGGAGDKFITADLGGGTLDMLAFEVLTDGNLKEICAGTGSKVGGQDVNNAFFQSCNDVIEGNAWHNIGSKNSGELLVLEKEFEDKKVQIGSGDERDEKINVPIPHSVRKMVEKGEVTIKPGMEKSKYFRINKEKLMYDSALVREILFNETVGLVLGQIKEILGKKELKEVKTMVLVGGFAESHIVVGKIRSLLSEKYPYMRVVVPTSPFRAVLKGAVLYGHDPLIFQSRISRATFGVRSNSIFDPEKHDVKKKWLHEGKGKYYCEDIFSIHVRKDSSVKLQEKQPSHVYNPMYNEQTSIPVPIFMSSEPEPKYTTDEGCKQIGVFDVDIPITEGGASRNVKVEMIYGGTELSVIATDENSGKEHLLDIKFDEF